MAVPGGSRERVALAGRSLALWQAAKDGFGLLCAAELIERGSPSADLSYTVQRIIGNMPHRDVIEKQHSDGFSVATRTI